MNKLVYCAVAALALELTAVVGVHAQQNYPIRPIRLIVPYPPGGGTDIMARVISLRVSESLGQPVVVDNRPGAGGSTGTEMAVRAEPDGYTLIMVAGSYSAGAALYKPPYDPVNDIQPIVLIGEVGLAVTLHPAMPIKSVKELIAYARTNPGKLNYGSAGAGTVMHLAGELFKLEGKVDLTHVPYKGGGPVMNALIGGEIQLCICSTVPSIPHVKAGRLRVIAVTTGKRSMLLPDLPTVSETVPGYEVIHWYGMWGPKGMPREIVARWNKEVAIVLQSEEMKKRLAGEGLEPAGGPPDQFLQTIRRDVEKWKKVVREAKITVAS
jgi:tripartite-type tricarboxylate transporter receptor subunit TctC